MQTRFFPFANANLLELRSLDSDGRVYERGGISPRVRDFALDPVPNDPDRARFNEWGCKINGNLFLIGGVVAGVCLALAVWEFAHLGGASIASGPLMLGVAVGLLVLSVGAYLSVGLRRIVTITSNDVSIERVAWPWRWRSATAVCDARLALHETVYVAARAGTVNVTHEGWALLLHLRDDGVVCLAERASEEAILDYWRGCAASALLPIAGTGPLIVTPTLPRFAVRL